MIKYAVFEYHLELYTRYDWEKLLSGRRSVFGGSRITRDTELSPGYFPMAAESTDFVSWHDTYEDAVKAAEQYFNIHFSKTVEVYSRRQTADVGGVYVEYAESVDDDEDGFPDMWNGTECFICTIITPERGDFNLVKASSDGAYYYFASEVDSGEFYLLDTELSEQEERELVERLAGCTDRAAVEELRTTDFDYSSRPDGKPGWWDRSEAMDGMVSWEYID